MLSTPFSGFTSTVFHALHQHHQPFNSLFGIPSRIGFRELDIELVLSTPFSGFLAMIIGVIVMAYFQLPFRDSAATSRPAGGTPATSSFNSLFGIRGRPLPRGPGDSCFQLPFRDSWPCPPPSPLPRTSFNSLFGILYSCTRLPLREIHDFQLPFRDSSTSATTTTPR